MSAKSPHPREHVSLTMHPLVLDMLNRVCKTNAISLSRQIENIVRAHYGMPEGEYESSIRKFDKRRRGNANGIGS